MMSVFTSNRYVNFLCSRLKSYTMYIFDLAKKVPMVFKPGSLNSSIIIINVSSRILRALLRTVSNQLQVHDYFIIHYISIMLILNKILYSILLIAITQHMLLYFSL